MKNKINRINDYLIEIESRKAYSIVFNMNSITLINKNLNNGIDNIICIRIIDIIEKIKNGELSGLTRKEAKILWVISGKKKELFDNSIWSI